MTVHAPNQNAATIRRMQHLVHLLAATIAEGDCNWSETVAALSYTLATVLDVQPDDDMRLRLGRQFAGRLERAAGETETNSLRCWTMRWKSIKTLRTYVKRADLFEDHAGAAFPEEEVAWSQA